jgi:hypothetical protein
MFPGIGPTDNRTDSNGDDIDEFMPFTEISGIGNV